MCLQCPLSSTAGPNSWERGRLCNLGPDRRHIPHRSIFGSGAHSSSSGQLLRLKVFPLLFPKSPVCLYACAAVLLHSYIHTNHPHSLYVLKTDDGALLFCPALCILKDEFMVSVSVIERETWRSTFTPAHSKKETTSTPMTPAPPPPNPYNHLPRKELSHPKRCDVMNGACKITNSKEEAWCSNGRFRMRDSCGNQTIVLCPCALSYGMVNICCSGAQRKLEKSPETNRIAHILL